MAWLMTKITTDAALSTCIIVIIIVLVIIIVIVIVIVTIIVTVIIIVIAVDIAAIFVGIVGSVSPFKKVTPRRIFFGANVEPPTVRFGFAVKTGHVMLRTENIAIGGGVVVDSVRGEFVCVAKIGRVLVCSKIVICVVAIVDISIGICIVGIAVSEVGVIVSKVVASTAIAETHGKMPK